MGWKYIMIEINVPNSKTKMQFPIIFPDKLIHAEVAAVMKLVAPLDGNNPHIVSAGCIGHIEVDGLYGESTTLQIKSRPEDRGVIENYSYAHGIL
jgi:hypothetical protein